MKAFFVASDVVSAQSVVEKVKDLFDGKFSFSGMTYWPKNNDFSSKKKSQPVPANADAIEQRAFIAKYLALRDNLPKLLFLDAAHPTMATKLSYGWSTNGERKIVATTADKTCIM